MFIIGVTSTTSANGNRKVMLCTKPCGNYDNKATTLFSEIILQYVNNTFLLNKKKIGKERGKILQK